MDSATTDALTVSFEQSSYTVAESDDTSTTGVTENEVTVKVVLNTHPDDDLTVPITTTEQDGASSTDYSGAPANVALDAADQDTEAEITFTATTDDVGTLPEEVTAGRTTETTVNITDDDIAVGFEQAPYTVAEGSNVTVKVTLGEGPEATATIPITKTEQDGASSADYSGVPANVVFNSGDTEKTFTFTATQDTADDDDESVKLGFGALPTGIVSGTNNETTVNITDDDVPGVNVSFEQSSYTVDEGANITVKVALSADPERTVTVPINKTNQNGASDSDYSGVPANVTFNSGDTEKSITFTAIDDAVDDDGESVKLAFGTLPTGVTEGTNDETTVNINDDDAPTSLTVNFGEATYTVAEGSNVTVKVTLDMDPEMTVTIPINKANQDGASDSDYSGVPSIVVFNSGDAEKTFTVRASQDTVDDDGESVRLSFGTLPTVVSAGPPVNRW